MTLYEILGADPTDFPDELKRAYREASKRTHPDHGGDPEAFKRIAAAWEVLGDPVKRARYDQGESAESILGQAKTEHMEISETLSSVLSVVMGQLEDVDHANVIGEMRKALTHGLNGIRAEMARIKAQVAKWEKFLKRLKSDSEDCPLAAHAKYTKGGAERAIADMERQIRIGELALERLAKYGYDFEKAPDPYANLDPLQSAALFGSGAFRASWSK